ncbi:hypothetical protein HDU83_007034 [Entophlyctis luteolus]|nr:hypothetical protein HDU83_007034 [Entophlyctis luteolus]
MTDFIASQLHLHFGLSDEAYVEYIAQLCDDESIPVHDKTDIITEFLQEAAISTNSSALSVTPDQVRQVVESMVERLATDRAAAAAEAAAASAATEGRKEEHPGTRDPTTVEPASAGPEKKILTKEEKRARERLLRQYGYEVDETVEDANGEVEFLYSGGGRSGQGEVLEGSVAGNMNVQRAKEAEQMRRSKMATEHANEAERNRRAREKQLADAEKKKRGTVKQEKRRIFAFGRWDDFSLSCMNPKWQQYKAGLRALPASSAKYFPPNSKSKEEGEAKDVVSPGTITDWERLADLQQKLEKEVFEGGFAVGAHTTSAPPNSLSVVPRSLCVVCNSDVWRAKSDSLLAASIAAAQAKVQSGIAAITNQQNAPTSREEPSDNDDSFTATEQFLSLLNGFSASCESCKSKTLVAIVGASGVGKSTILNVLSGFSPEFKPSHSGSKTIEFRQQVLSPTATNVMSNPFSRQKPKLVPPIAASSTPAIVSSSPSSATNFPLFSIRTDVILADFPGFFDTRGGVLEFVQSIFMAKVLTARPAKIILVKSVLDVKDSSFATFLNSGLVSAPSCLVVFTKANNKTSTNWADYVDETDPLKSSLIKKLNPPGGPSLKCTKIMQLEFYESLKDSVKAFVLATNSAVDVSTLIPTRPPIAMVPPSATIQKFANDSIKRLKSKISQEVCRRLEATLPSYKFQPYNVSSLRTLLCESFETPKPILSALKMLGLLGGTGGDFKSSYSRSSSVSDDAVDESTLAAAKSIDILDKYVDFWKIFHDSNLLQEEYVSAANFIKPAQMALLTNASQTPEEKIGITADTPLHTKLLKWTIARECFHLEYISYKAQLQILMRRAFNPEFFALSINESKRLITYRLTRCLAMEEAWCLVAKDIEEIMNRPTASTLSSSDVQSSRRDWDFEFIGKLMDLDALRETLRIGLQSRGSIRDIIKNLSIVAPVATVLPSVGQSTGIISVGQSTGMMVAAGSALVAGALVLAIIANYVYIQKKNLKPLGEGGILGLDFSEFGLEKEIWNAAMELVEVSRSAEAPAASANLDGIFKVYEEKFSWDLIQRRKYTDTRFSEIQDAREDSEDTENTIKSWISVVATNQKLMHTIISKLQGRAKNVAGCSYYEHSLKDEFRLIPVTVRCCGFLGYANYAKRCEHCDAYFHDSESNKQCLSATRTILCRDRISNTASVTEQTNGKLSTVRVFFFDKKQFPLLDWNSLSPEDKHITVNLSEAIYSAALRADFNIPKSTVVELPEDDVRFFVTGIGETAFVVFRGTKAESSRNWLANISIGLAKLQDEENASFQSGYLRICQKVIVTIWESVLQLKAKRVVITGHSLGGALAHTLHLLLLIEKFETAMLPIISVGFGSPPPFGRRTQKFFDDNPELVRRFVTFANYRDPIPLALKAVEQLDKITAGGAAMVDTTFGEILPISNDIKTALNIAFFVPRKIAAQYQYVGMYVFFGGKGRQDVNVQGESAVLLNHDVVSRWMEMTKLEECSLECHSMKIYSRFVVSQYE